MSKLKGDTIIGLRPDGSRLLNDGGKRAIERLRTNEALKEDLEQATKLLALVHVDLKMRADEDGVVDISNFIWERLKEYEGKDE